VWQHSGVFRDGLVELLESFGAEVVPLGRSETFVPIDTEAVSADHAAQIAAWVREHALAALVSTDGDADRPLVADETGALVRGDILGALTARYLGIEAVATPITSTSALEASGWFHPVIRTRVGSPHVLAGMEQAGLAGGPVLGFEANGGALLGAPVRINYKEIPALPTRDAMLPILCVLGLALQTGLPLSQLVAALPARFARSGRLENVPPERSEALLDELSEAFFAEVGTVSDVGDLDGSRIVFESGDVIHYRASGNAPELRCYTEADTAERADWLLNWGLAAAERMVR
jgi:phosphomannomutase